MFKGGEHKFKGGEHMFKARKHRFKGRKYKIYRTERRNKRKWLIRFTWNLRLLQMVLWRCELPAVGDLAASCDSEGQLLRTWDGIEWHDDGAQFHMLPQRDAFL